MEWSFLWVIFVVLVMDGYLYWHFNHIYNAQYDLTSRLIAKIKGATHEENSDDFGFDITGNEVMQNMSEDDPNRTHILGGFVHGEAICSDDCWCATQEEE